MNTYLKKSCLIFISLFGMSLSLSFAQLSEPLPFMTHAKPLSAEIVDLGMLDTVPSTAALVRLPNRKIVYMVKEQGKWEPFYVKAIETGYWDTRYEKDTDYDSVFADMREMGANTAYVMLHWEDIEPADNRFDYSFADSVVAAAGRQGLKVGWVLFLHAQKERVPSLKPETAWTFHLDDRDSSNYTMQWVKRDGKLYSNIKDILDYGVRPLHVYGHKEIFYRVRRMLYQLARHYRFDETVIGVQLGNEEGFSFLDESDFNPVTAELYKEWMHKTNKTDYAQFKKEAMDWWWQQFTSAYHEGDPYKIISFNLDAAQAEAGDPERVAMTGTSASTYADGNLDVIGTMFYKGWGYKAILGLDHRYNNSYNYQLPILIPSEIGIGRFNSPVWFRHFIAHTLERAAQGFGVYCYGEVRKELPELGDVRNELIRMLKNISLNEDIIWEGLPGPGAVSCQVDEPGVQVSHLNKNGQETLALIYFPEAKEMTDSSRIARLQSLKLNCKAQKKGHYKVDVYKNDECIKSNSLSLKAGISRSIPIDGIRMDDIVFVSIRQDIYNKNNNKGKEL